MMHKQIIHVLLVNLSDSDAEQLGNSFRKTGQVVREDRVSSGEQLSKRLSDQQWELIVFDDERASLDIKHCGNMLRKQGIDIPVIFIGDADPLSPPDPVISAVFGKYEFPRLAAAALREIQGLQLRRQMNELRHSLEVAEQRSQLLMNESKDPVAYIVDGMIIHANRVFCDGLGYDDLDGFPIVDLVEHKDQERLKNALKQQGKGKEDRQLELAFRGRDGSSQTSIVHCSNTQYDDEDCIQVLLSELGADGNFGNIDETTGLATRHYFEQSFQEFIESERNNNSSLLLISIDNFQRLRQKTGLKGAELLVAELCGQLRIALNAQIYGRIGDDIVAAVAHHVPSQNALEMAEDLVKNVEEGIFEVKKQSIQLTLSVAIMPINHRTPPAASAVLDNSFDFLQRLVDSGGNQAQIVRRERQQLENSQSAAKLVQEALAEQRLQLLFEPMVNLGSASGDHYEVSLDLRDRAEGEITAGELQRNIERDPDHNELDRWMVMEATKLLAKERLGGKDVKLVINLSGNVFHDQEFCSWLGVAIKAAGLPASALTLQFSEESISNSLKPALDFCKQFQTMGGEIGVRNFGRVKASDKFLNHIQPGLVKPGIRSSDSPDNSQIRDFIRSAKTLGSRIVIPNVGSAATLAMLWQLGPDFIQGSYVHEPQPSMTYEFSAFS
ncbi:EAL domain-containing protein [Spongiibacter taiwanensis]|uniref:EAL domain-containing protein n=1 Tax=Spongiibacter taiwanensis TaxID=1748242 RepID=UPI002036569B|nr:EAL domain-containing protein [Spongiibacter taiwanensis]USA42427.1 EAL domain-containing protein [Spongiibacter taiwanensis]